MSAPGGTSPRGRIEKSTAMKTYTKERLTMLANGFSPIKNRDKRTFTAQWPTLNITPDLILSWDRMSRDKATGVRIENGLCAIDFDIDDKAAMTEIANAIFERTRLGDESNGAVLFRKGKGAKEAWFCRTKEQFSHLYSRAWTRPGESVEDGTHRIEIFGGGSPRQFGCRGAHTVADDGTVEVEYSYPERSPLDTRVDELIELTKAECSLIVDTVERTLKRLGWEPVLRATRGDAGKRKPGDNPQASLELLTAAMAVIPNDNLPWEEWNRVGMALWRASEGSCDAMGVFDEWSRKSAKYDGCEERWDAYERSPPDRIGAGTIFYMANEADPSWRARPDIAALFKAFPKHSPAVKDTFVGSTLLRRLRELEEGKRP